MGGIIPSEAAGMRSDRVRISRKNRIHESDHRIRSGNHRARGNRDWTNRPEFLGDHCRVAGLLVSLRLFLSPFIYPCLWVGIAGFPSNVIVRCRVPGILVYFCCTYIYIYMYLIRLPT